MTYENRIKAIAKQELERELEEFEKHRNEDSPILDDAGVFVHKVNFAFKLELINAIERQRYCDELKKKMEKIINLLKIKKERQDEFREMVVNLNDDITTPRELMLQSRENEKRNLDSWKRDIQKHKENAEREKKQNDGTDNDIQLNLEKC